MPKRLAHVVGCVALACVLVAAVLNGISHSYYLFRQGCRWASPDPDIKLLAYGDPQITGTWPGMPLRKRLDIRGNDLYLHHVFQTTKRRFAPQAVAVMGDLISSQWIEDDEFYKRAERYRAVFSQSASDTVEVFNVSGNHDIGYNGEMNDERVDRFEKAYGPVNLVREFGPADGFLHPWRIVVINSVSLDGPAYDPKHQERTRVFLRGLAEGPVFEGATVLLTHVPLHKPGGICRDSDFFEYYEWGTLRAQNHLSRESTDLVLQSVFPHGNPHGGIVLAGHDHEGCSAVFDRDPDTKQWTPRGGSDAAGDAQLLEITVRSMMGEYGGNTGLVSASWDGSRYDFGFSLCRFGVQHFWWVTEVVTYVAAGLTSLHVILYSMSM